MGRPQRRHHGGHHHQLRVEEHAFDPRVPHLRNHNGSALRSGMRAEGAGAALSEVRVQLPGNAGDIGQHGGFQRRRVTNRRLEPYRHGRIGNERPDSVNPLDPRDTDAHPGQV